jgi:hypothetical protein
VRIAPAGLLRPAWSETTWLCARPRSFASHRLDARRPVALAFAETRLRLEPEVRVKAKRGSTPEQPQPRKGAVVYNALHRLRARKAAPRDVWDRFAPFLKTCTDFGRGSAFWRPTDAQCEPTDDLSADWTWMGRYLEGPRLHVSVTVDEGTLVPASFSKPVRRELTRRWGAPERELGVGDGTFDLSECTWHLAEARLDEALEYVAATPAPVKEDSPALRAAVTSVREQLPFALSGTRWTHWTLKKKGTGYARHKVRMPV